jgi:hypothetical protein
VADFFEASATSRDPVDALLGHWRRRRSAYPALTLSLNSIVSNDKPPSRAKTVLRGLLAQFGRLHFAQAELLVQTGEFAFSDWGGHHTRQSVGPNLRCKAVDFAFEVKKLADQKGCPA